uniref:Uncharacterized protein TCIL3000_11_16820 n=1 Tax=Trypanosoma congolense (strain IL3000) TaxID=1068625 RepID=G0V3E5_TRYCI|nr:unnamed protein product [Trypanosoma congolense IL3000]
MLFEPSGDLRLDYGAFCHTIGVIEREEVYRSLITNKQQRAKKELKYCSSAEDGPMLQQFDEATEVQSQTVKGVAGANKMKDATKGSSPGRKHEGESPARRSLPGETPLVHPTVQQQPTLYHIVMRHLTFCLNERDMKPLALAIPYCTTLMSIEFIGCGLSRESYFLLVEAAYKSRRLVSMAIDFNNVSRPGFYEDPTVNHPASEPPRLVEHTSGDEASPGRFGDESKSTVFRDVVPSRLDGFLASPRVESAGSSRRTPETVHTFSPSNYRGLNNVPSLLEVQIREERERKGKIDSKKQAQLQQQRELLAQFDKENRIPVPRGWSAALLTGVRQLSLRGNGIGDKDVALMASVLLVHSRSELRSLNLWGNNITDEGAVSLSALLKKNRTLQVLDLGQNDIGDTGLAALVDCFRMQEMPMEELPAYRRQYLMRCDATLREKNLAGAPPPHYPTYQEVYNAWHMVRYATPEDRRESKKGLSKTKRTDSISTRPTTPFDCDCFRIDDPPRVRAPGNTVMRCINLGNNKRVTYAGASEALRVLSLHEPADDDEMSMLRDSVTKPPELYCASIVLSSFVVQHMEEPRLREVQNQINKMLHLRLEKLKQAPLEATMSADETRRRTPRGRK